MAVRYERGLLGNFLILSDPSVGEEDYQVQMVLQNSIRGLLPVHREGPAGGLELWYEMTGYESLQRRHEAQKLDARQIKTIFMAVNTALEETARYLLKGTGILLDPQMIFQNFDSGEIAFVYNPAENGNPEEELRRLMLFIVNHVDTEDRPLLETAYRLLDASMRENMTLQSLTTMAIEGLSALNQTKRTLEIPQETKAQPSQQPDAAEVDGKGRFLRFGRKKEKAEGAGRTDKDRDGMRQESRSIDGQYRPISTPEEQNAEDSLSRPRHANKPVESIQQDYSSKSNEKEERARKARIEAFGEAFADLPAMDPEQENRSEQSAASPIREETLNLTKDVKKLQKRQEKKEQRQRKTQNRIMMGKDERSACENVVFPVIPFGKALSLGLMAAALFFLAAFFTEKLTVYTELKRAYCMLVSAVLAGLLFALLLWVSCRKGSVISKKKGSHV